EFVGRRVVHSWASRIIAMETGGTSSSKSAEHVRFIVMPAKRSERITLVVMFAIFAAFFLVGSVAIIFNGQASIGLYVFATIMIAGMVGLSIWFGWFYRRGPWRSSLTVTSDGYAFRYFLRKDPRGIGKLKPWQPGMRLEVMYMLGSWAVRVVQRRETSLDSAMVRSGMHAFESPKTSAFAVKLRPRLLHKVARAEPIIDAALGDDAPVRENVGAISHCPECAYDLRGNGRAAQAATTTGACPECGWQWSAGDVVLFGSLTYGSAPRWPGRRWNLDIVGTILLVTVVPQVVVLGLVFLLIYIWRDLSPVTSTIATATIVVFALAALAWSILTFTKLGESAKEKRDRLERQRHLPAGNWVLRLTSEGFVQHLGLTREAPLFDWNTETRWKVQHWPGGVRVVARPKGWLLNRRPRPHVDFIVRTADHRAAKRQLRRVVRARLAESGRESLNPAR
ncbi:MAG: hypothetical protein AAGK78_05830, partial [Planctomycetota bacterium]